MLLSANSQIQNLFHRLCHFFDCNITKVEYLVHLLDTKGMKNPLHSGLEDSGTRISLIIRGVHFSRLLPYSGSWELRLGTIESTKKSQSDRLRYRVLSSKFMSLKC